MIAHVQILEGDNVRPVLIELDQEMEVLRRIVKAAEIEFECRLAVGSGTVNLVVDTLLSTLVDAQVAP